MKKSFSRVSTNSSTVEQFPSLSFSCASLSISFSPVTVSYFSFSLSYLSFSLSYFSLSFLTFSYFPLLSPSCSPPVISLSLSNLSLPPPVISLLYLYIPLSNLSFLSPPVIFLLYLSLSAMSLLLFLSPRNLFIISLSLSSYLSLSHSHPDTRKCDRSLKNCERSTYVLFHSWAVCSWTRK